MSRPFTKFESALISELANVASMLVDRLEGLEYLDLSSVAIREVIETAVRVAAAHKRLERLRPQRQPGRHDALKLDAAELARLRLGGLDLDSAFGCEDLKS